MDEETRASIQGELWKNVSGPELLRMLQNDEFSMSFHDNGARIKLLTDRGWAQWDLADAPSADRFLPAPA